MAFYPKNNIPEQSVTTSFTDWKPFIDNTQNNLDEIEKIGGDCYIEPEKINLFYSRIKSFISIRKAYLKTDTQKIVYDRLNNISNKLFSKDYILELQKQIKSDNYNNISFITIQNKILNDLFDLLSIVAEDFKYFRLLYAPDVQEREFSDVEDPAIREVVKAMSSVINRK